MSLEKDYYYEEPAAPCGGEDQGFSPFEGMTLLDHFAGLALPAAMDEMSRVYAQNKNLGVTLEQSIELAAEYAYKNAAAMIEVRRKYLPNRYINK